jgi:hypothetical protein
METEVAFMLVFVNFAIVFLADNNAGFSPAATVLGGFFADPLPSTSGTSRHLV